MDSFRFAVAVVLHVVVGGGDGDAVVVGVVVVIAPSVFLHSLRQAKSESAKRSHGNHHLPAKPAL